MDRKMSILNIDFLNIDFLYLDFLNGQWRDGSLCADLQEKPRVRQKNCISLPCTNRTEIPYANLLTKEKFCIKIIVFGAIDIWFVPTEGVRRKRMSIASVNRPLHRLTR